MTKFDLTDLEKYQDEEVEEDSAIAGVSSSAGTHRRTAEEQDEVDLLTQRLAVLTVRRMCNQHACTTPSTGSCGHPEHRRDVDYLAHCLEVLKLPGDYVEVPEEERRDFLRGSTKRGGAVPKR